MQDMAILTGGEVIAEELGGKLENVQLNQLGKCRRVIIDKDNTTIVGGSGKKPEINGRIELIRAQIEDTTSDYDREKLQERLAKLTGGVAVIRVGAATEVELKEKKMRVDDAVHAVRAAAEEGVVPVAASRWCGRSRRSRSSSSAKSEKSGAEIVERAMSEPLKQIVFNAGLEPAVVFNQVAEGKGDYGYNAATDEYEDMVKAGVIDPAKVVRTALENAASAASLLLTTEAAIAELPKKAAPPAMPHGGWVEWEAWAVWEAWAEWEWVAWAVWGEWAAWAMTSAATIFNSASKTNRISRYVGERARNLLTSSE